jgi:hypothetical protein
VVAASLKAAVEKMTAMIEEMARVAAREARESEPSCDRGAASVYAVLNPNRSAIEATKTRLIQNPGKRAWFDQKYEARLTAAFADFVPFVEKCKDHPAIRRTFESLEVKD